MKTTWRRCLSGKRRSDWNSSRQIANSQRKTCWIKMSTKRTSRATWWIVQILVFGVAAASWQWGAAAPVVQRPRDDFPRHYRPVETVPRTSPLVIAPLYDDPEVVSDEELAGVLAKIRPVFPAEYLKPN